MDSWNSIVMLADENGDSGGIFRILFFLIVAVVWILGAIGKKFAERKAEEELEKRSRQRRADTSEALGEYEEQAGQDEGWDIVAPPPLPLVSEPQRGRLAGAGNIEPAMPSETVLSHKKQTAAKLIRFQKKSAGPTPQPVPVPLGFAKRQSTDEAIRSHVSLTSPDDARTAMIYYEIFAPPRALREELPRWET
jgi:hypothetical protein